MLEPLSDDLVGRIKSRADNPDTRNDSPPSSRGRTISAGGLSIMGMDVNAILRGAADPRIKPGAALLADPAPEAAIVEAERRLQFPLPAPVRQLYLQIAD